MVHSMTHDVFISHSSKDKNIAYAVCAALEDAKIKCWIAPRNILPGDKWGSAITKAVTGSRIMVLIFSDNSNNSDNVMDELLLAKNAGAIIIPFKIEDILPNGEMELYLNRTHWLDAMNPPTEKQMQVLVETVKKFLKTEITEDKDKKDVTINGYEDYLTQSKETDSSSFIPNIDLTTRVEPVALTPHMEEQKGHGKFQRTYFIVAALIMILIVGFFMLEPDTTEISPLNNKNDEKYIDDLIESLSNGDENVRNDSIAALVEIGEPAIDPLIQSLNGDEENQVYIVQVLVEIGEPAIEPLIQATNNTNNLNPNARYSAVQALDMIIISLKTPPNLTYPLT